jgi:hypothetical protein
MTDPDTVLKIGFVLQTNNESKQSPPKGVDLSGNPCDGLALFFQKSSKITRRYAKYEIQNANF